ncbi:hypothetical protein [Nocardia carnea]|uniref:hypothetical protein n=1 Tax=Nocardia carnea TaxID=37328 RepID=UPI0024561983|nr:hypothetical protein [Nocardia carnea]
MTDPDEHSTALDAALSRSLSADGMTRDNAIFELADFIEDERAIERLREMLDDDIITMQVDAADVLARRAGVKGLMLVLDEIGRRRDDPDADYIANRLYELDAGGDIPILELIEPRQLELSEDARIGFRQLKVLRGRE